MHNALEQWVEQMKEKYDRSFELIQNEAVPWAPWNTSVSKSKVALVSTGAVYLSNGLHQPFLREEPGGDPSFREFPSVVMDDDLKQDDVSYDAQYGEQDINVVFPLERLRELAEGGYIGSVAPFAYSFQGHITRPDRLLSDSAVSVAYRMRRMGADVALVVAVGLLGHQTAGLVARLIELAGISTVVLGTNRSILEAVKPPRAVVVQHPEGAPLGNPANVGKHQYLLREVLSAGWDMEGPGSVVELPFTWSGQ